MTIDLETLPTTTVLIKRAAALNVNLTMFDMLTQGGMRKEVSKRSVALWKSQKTCESERTEWLKKEVKERAAAARDEYWEKRLDQMIRVAESRAINRNWTQSQRGVSHKH